MPSFADRLGERFVVAQPSGALLEFLVFHPGLSSAATFESSVKTRLKRLSNFRHAAYARATRLQRDPIRGNRLTLVSAYTAGRRLSDVLALARRGKIQPPMGAVLSLAKQLMTGAALLHDYAPDVFHGAIGAERLVLGSEGRLVITEYVLGTAVEQAVPEWGVPRLWRECRLAVLPDASLPRFGRRIDLVQIGVVVLSLLTGRLLADGDFPAKLPDLLDAARDTRAEGESASLVGPLREWLSKLLCIEPDSAFRTLVEAQKAFGRIIEADARHSVSADAVEAFVRQCDDVEPLAIPRPEPPAPEGPSVAVAVQPAEVPPNAVKAEPADVPPVAVKAEPAEVPPPPIAAPPLIAPAAVAPPPSVITSQQPAVVAPEPAADEAPVASTAPVDDAVAEMLAALPKPLQMESGVDPFAPWPTSTGLHAERPPASVGLAPEEPSPLPPPAPSVEVVSNAWDGGRSQPAAREAAPAAAPPSQPVPVLPREPARAWPPPPEPLVGASKFEVERFVTAEFIPEPEIPEISGLADHATGGRRGAVLSYDEVHRSASRRRSLVPLVWAAVALVVLAVAGVVGGPRIGALLKGVGKTSNAAAQPATGPTEHGGFKITTQPSGSRVSIDGTPRGKAPLLVDDLAPGLHSVVVESDWGTLEEAVTVEAGKVVPLALATVGWIKVEAPVELEVSEEGRTYGVTGQPLMVPAGRHAFIFSNRSVAVRHRQFVQVPAGQTVKVGLDLPQGILNLTSDQPAQVLLDGEVIGDTPQVSVPAALGLHEVVFRSARYGDVSYSVNVTLAAPVSISANFGARR